MPALQKPLMGPREKTMSPTLGTGQPDIASLDRQRPGFLATCGAWAFIVVLGVVLCIAWLVLYPFMLIDSWVRK
jgi:hypothetical protein